MHYQVRDIQFNVRNNKRLVVDAQLQLRRLEDISLNDNRRAALEAKIDELGRFNELLEASIPQEWATQRPMF